MSIPTAATTDAELWQTYDDAASYDVAGSASLAGQFIVACRLILRRRTSRATIDGTAIDFESVREDLQRAEHWLAAVPPAAGTSMIYAGKSEIGSAAEGPRFTVVHRALTTDGQVSRRVRRRCCPCDAKAGRVRRMPLCGSQLRRP